MRNYFLQVRKFILDNYSNIDWQINGDNYPPTERAIFIANMTSYLWIIGIALLMGGSFIFKALGVPEPRFYVEMNNNKVACFIVLFMLNSWGNSGLATGAFEIYYNNNLIYSKLETGRLPTGEDLIYIFTQAGIKR